VINFVVVAHDGLHQGVRPDLCVTVEARLVLLVDNHMVLHEGDEADSVVVRMHR
jgi:hypothetical protein